MAVKIDLLDDSKAWNRRPYPPMVPGIPLCFAPYGNLLRHRPSRCSLPVPLDLLGDNSDKIRFDLSELVPRTKRGNLYFTAILPPLMLSLKRKAFQCKVLHRIYNQSAWKQPKTRTFRGNKWNMCRYLIISYNS
jgi:hypothetical protein